ncbi:MAG: LTA synthase family protein [Cytophagaceae bacterium]|nr:LTA synthase family protein [Cytophagaceae bacterium]
MIDKENFPEESWNSKWGAHDEVVFDRMLTDLNKAKAPFFYNIFTLTSHEPFEIPAKPLLPGKDDESLFLSSMHYTDSCLADFIAKAKKSSWWDNTIIIITADHGHRLPGAEAANHLPAEFKIPMLWLGGALLKKDTIINTIGSQTDISKTLFKQINIPSEEYIFSKDLLAKCPHNFAYYAYQNGFGFITENGQFVFDNISKSFLLKDPDVTEEDVRNGKSYLWVSFQEYLNK